MRYPADRKKETRDRIVRAAARRFRSRGSEGAAIGDLMRDLRLTHGGFYRHFGSKEELFAETFGHDVIAQRIFEAIEAAPSGEELQALIDTYLSIEHCNNLAEGCAVTALASELARRPPTSKARIAFEKLLKERTKRVARYLPGEDEEERVLKARMLMSGMAGTMAVARVLRDERQKRQFLENARKFYFDSVQR